MGSCAIRNPFWQNSSARSTLQFIPYKRLEQTTHSWSAGHLKSSKSAKTPNINRNTSITSWVLVRFDWFLICYVLHDPLYNSFHIIALNGELFPRAVVSWNSSISEIAMKNLNNFMSSCAIRIIFDFLCSASSGLQFVPYNHFDPRTPS